MWHLFLSIIIQLAYPCSNNAATSVFEHFTTDSVVLYKRDTLVTIGKEEVVLPFSVSDISIDTGISHFFLVLENVSLNAMPEGVYEVYINEAVKNKSKLRLHHQSNFVSLLDLYSLTAPGAEAKIAVDISKKVKELKSKRKKISGCVLIRFAGIELKNGKRTNNAGKLLFKKYKIIKTA